MRILFAFVFFAATIAVLPYTTYAANDRDAGGLAAIHKLHIEGNRLCMADHPHYGQTGTWPTLAAAKTSAVKSWSGFTRLEYGEEWADFAHAAAQKFDCSASSDSRGPGWTCNVEARPCKR